MRKKQMGSVCSEKKNYGDPKLYNLYAVAACSTGICKSRRYAAVRPVSRPDGWRFRAYFVWKK